MTTEYPSRKFTHINYLSITMENNLILIFVFLGLTLWVWAILDITRSRFKSPMMNTIFLLIVLFFPFIGSIVYFILRKNLITTRKRKFQPKFNRNFNE